ncbi:MAG: metalloregulator ArsR/SmtB family transcription factor [Dehalococcoidales bacterium]|nr:metalloregulator ArsR/SmtB family transcription factor [Dehalococcoidales bacterium]
MDKHNFELYQLKADMCKSFADPKRLMIIAELRSGEKTVTELMKLTQIPQAVISRQLGILKTKGIVQPRRAGNNIYYSIIDLRVCDACDIVHQVLMNSLTKNHKTAGNLLKQ